MSWVDTNFLSGFRVITGLETTDISDANVYALGTYALSFVNSQINVRVVREKVEYIDSTRENDVDGSNTTFYVKNWEGNWIGDIPSSPSGLVGTYDITFYEVDNQGNESTIPISSVNSTQGKIVTSTAPASDSEAYIDYYYTGIDMDTPDRRYYSAVIFLTASMAQARLNIGKAPRVKLGSTDITRDMKAPDYYWNKYLEVINEINVENNKLHKKYEAI